MFGIIKKKCLLFALQGILLGRESIAKEMQDLLHEATDPWGVLVERVEVCVAKFSAKHEFQ